MTGYSQLTYTGILLSVLANQLCLPIPSVMFLIAAGALSAEGKMSGPLIAGLCVLPCLAADAIWFWLGRKWGPEAMRLLCRLAPDPRACSGNAQRQFRRFGTPVLLVAKFLPGLDGLIPPLAGAEGVPLAWFLSLDAVGSLVWSGFYVGTGYIFASQVDLAIVWAERFGTALLVAAGVLVALYAGWQALEILRMFRQLQLRRITPRMLYRKLKINARIAVLDLMNFDDEDHESGRESVPGAVRVDPDTLRNSPRLALPEDIQIVLYCSSKRDIVSTRVAMGLKRIGVDNVWVLEGGLEAWRREGLPTARYPEEPDAVAGRLGVILPVLQ